MVLQAIQDFFDGLFNGESSTDEQQEAQALQLATAALFLEMVRMDDELKESEMRAVARAVQEKFQLAPDKVDELVRLADEEARQSTDYYQFTSLINRGFTPEQKNKLIEYLWQIAYADGVIDKHEEHMVRKVADLLYLSHSAFIAAKHRAQKTTG